MLKSYYEILDITPDATKAQIKKQFKKFAKMYHPDINSSFEAEQRFKEINKAAEILLDDEKRKNYDALRCVNSAIYNSQNKKNSQNFQNRSDYTFSDLFSKNKKEYNKKAENIQKAIDGNDITLNVKIDYKEAILGTHRIVNINHSSICPKCQGRKFANNQKCPNCNGLGEIIQNRKITVKIPPSIKNGAKLRLRGEGEQGKYGGKNGNLYVIVNIEDKKDFNIIDGTVYYDAYISPYTAILGGDVKVPTLWGEAIIKIPPLTKTNQSFKLVNVGVIDLKTNKKGDEIVKIVIQIPSHITDEEYSLYEKLKEINLKKKNARSFK